jgi:hypothetical protein
MWVIACISVFSILASGCSNERRLANGKPLKNRSSGAVLSRYERNAFQFEWVGMKISADVKSPDGKQGFKANLRMRKDSIIWISISPALGVEVLRVVITPDSVKYISKIPNNKHYFLGRLDEMSQFSESEIDFSMIQNMLLGNPVDLDPQRDKFTSRIDEQQYALISKYNRKMKKVVGMDDKAIEPDDSLHIDTSNKKYQRILKRSDEEDLLLKRYWFDGYDYSLVKTMFDDLYYKRSVTIEHDDFKEIDHQSYPQQTKMTLSTLEGTSTFGFKITRIKLNKEYEFPFETPKDYERKYTP